MVTFDPDYPSDYVLAVWPNCTTPDCENKQCSWAGVPLCFPCAERALGHDELIRRYDATHDISWAAEHEP